MRHPILLFDGECNFCRACVRWLVRRDPDGRLHYATLQSEVGRKLLRRHGADPESVESVALIDKGKLYWKSGAVLRAVSLCQSPWKVGGAFAVVPRFIRDWGYDRVSKNRSTVSRAVGTIEHEWHPPPEVADRFLSD